MTASRNRQQIPLPRLRPDFLMGAMDCYTDDISDLSPVFSVLSLHEFEKHVVSISLHTPPSITNTEERQRKALADLLMLMHAW